MMSHARFLVRLRQQLFLRGRAPGGTALPRGRREAAVAAVPARTDLHGAAGDQGLAVQHPARARPLHVARRGAALREVRAALQEARELSAAQHSRGPHRVHGAREAVVRRLHSRRLPRRVRAGQGHRHAGQPRRRAARPRRRPCEDLPRGPERAGEAAAARVHRRGDRVGCLRCSERGGGHELFFGQDRLEDAIAWAKRAQPGG